MLKSALGTLLVGFWLTTVAAAPSHAATVCAASPTTTWTGATSTTWTDPTNWSSGVPTTGADVCVPADMPNDPFIGLGVTADLNSIEVQVGATLTVNRGELDLATDSSIATLTVGGAGVIVNTDGALDIDTAFNVNQGTFGGTGQIISEIGTNFATVTAKTFNVDFVNNGTLLWSDGDIVATANTVTNNGTWNASGSGDTLTATTFANNGSFVKGNATTEYLVGTVANAGAFNLSGSATVNITGDTANSGYMNLSGGATLNTPSGNAFTQTGSLTVTGATLNRGAGTLGQSGGRIHLGTSGVINAATFNVSGGVAGGVGTYNGNVVVTGGALAPGGSYGVVGGIGTMTITGNLTQSAGQLQTELGSSYDVLAVTGTVTLSGTATLNVQANTWGYFPPNLANYNILTYSSISGTYATVLEDLNGNPDGYYTYDYGTSPLTITATYKGTITGTVYTDTNGNGANNGEPGKGGVTVFLDTNHNGVPDGGEPSTSSNGGGTYTFAGLLPGTYDVDIVTPGGFVQTSTELDSISVASAQTVSSQDVGVFQTAAITGQVFTDTNTNGTKDAGENGASGITVFNDANTNGSIDGGEVSTTTDGSGNYSLGSLPGGTYKPRVLLGYRTQTTPNPSDVVVTSGTGATNVNFGLEPANQVIAGQVFIDVNGNGTKDGGDTTGISGATVFVDTNHNGVANVGEPTSVTDGSGNYAFMGVPPGTYDIDVVDPTGYAQTTAELNTVGISVGQTVSGQNIGMYQAPPISGNVFNDRDVNGSRDSGETTGLPGVTVYLDLNNDGVKQGGEPGVTTDASGNYTFAAMAAGTYKVRAVLPAGAASQTTPNPSDIVVTSGNGATGVDIGLDASGSISGTVYTDDNGNGTQDGGEVVYPSATVFLDLNHNEMLDGGEPSTTSDGSGNYSFTSLDPVSWDVDVVNPTGYFQTSTELNAVAVGFGQAVTAQDIGLYQGPAVTGNVYMDVDNSGTMDSGDTGVAGVTVYADINNNSLLDLMEPRTSTSGTGDFALPAVIAGTYSIRIVPPVGAAQTSTNPAPVTITSGSGASGLEFGLDVLGSISGTVYTDTNDNGSMGGGETGTSGAAVYLDANHNGTLDGGEVSVTTDGSGNYTFDLLPAGTYDVKSVLGTDWVESSTPHPSVVVTTNEDVTGVNIGQFQTVSITGTVYQDTDNSGTKDSGETRGLSSVQVFLDTNNNGTPDIGEPVAITTANGTYAFNALRGGTYKVRAVAPTGATQTSSNLSDIIVTSGTGASNANIGFDVLGSITGSVYDDTNGNGTKNGGEPGLPGITVFLDTNHNGVLDSGEASTTTNGGGVYTFTNVDAATYDVDAVLASGWVQSSTELDSVVVATNQDVAGKNIGAFRTANVSGVVYYDTNGDGSQQAGETAVPNVIVYLDANGNSSRDNGEPYAMTGPDGTYTIPGVDQRLYEPKLFLTGLTNQTSLPPNDVDLTSGVDLTGVDFGIDRPYVPSSDPMAQGTGYWMIGSNGQVYSFGDAPALGSPSSLHLAAPIIGLAPTVTGGGYWAVGADGGVFSYGDATFHGSAASLHLNASIVDVQATPSGEGYWLLGGDGGVFSYGDAQFYGSTGSLRLNAPVNSMAVTPSGRGYWLVGGDGGVFCFGDAQFYGSMGGQHINGRVVGIAATPSGHGYWLVGDDGGVYAFGDAAFHGSAGGLRLASPIVGIRATATGSGYWLMAADGGVFAYGDAPYFGNPKGTTSAPVVG